jgi:hypothetical protein
MKTENRSAWQSTPTAQSSHRFDALNNALRGCRHYREHSPHPVLGQEIEQIERRILGILHIEESLFERAGAEHV